MEVDLYTYDILGMKKSLTSIPILIKHDSLFGDNGFKIKINKKIIEHVYYRFDEIDQCTNFRIINHLCSDIQNGGVLNSEIEDNKKSLISICKQLSSTNNESIEIFYSLKNDPNILIKCLIKKWDKNYIS